MIAPFTLACSACPRHWVAYSAGRLQGAPCPTCGAMSARCEPYETPAPAMPAKKKDKR